jgi:hypothetical protein
MNRRVVQGTKEEPRPDKVRSYAQCENLAFTLRLIVGDVRVIEFYILLIKNFF